VEVDQILMDVDQWNTDADRATEAPASGASPAKGAREEERPTPR
jgi:hypothetical protein